MELETMLTGIPLTGGLGSMTIIRLLQNPLLAANKNCFFNKFGVVGEK